MIPHYHGVILNQWRPVIGYEGFYEVSNTGLVRGVGRTVALSRGSKWMPSRLLKSSVNTARTNAVQVVLTRDRKLTTKKVPHLVLEAFVGPRPDGLVCCHNDGDATNNRVENLRWDTHSSNNYDLVRHGVHWQTVKTHCPQGHPYDEENTRQKVYRKGRDCRACEREKGRDRSRGAA